MPNARFRVYLSKYKEVLNQIWTSGCGGCNPLEDIGFLSYKVLKCHILVFLYHIILLASLIYFWRGVSRPPGSVPDMYVATPGIYTQKTCFTNHKIVVEKDENVRILLKSQ